MAYFIPKFLQKRIFRYVLSKLNILDTDALGLDDLDITWGSKSTVDLRDVSINRSKIASLLHLPERIQICKAKVDKISLSIPADLYKTPVVVELAGLTVAFDVFHIVGEIHTQPAKDAKTQSSAQEPTNASRAEGEKANLVTDNVSPFQRVPDSTTSSNKDRNSGSVLLNPKDLAQSFLAEESQEEMDALTQALHRSQGLAESGRVPLNNEATADLGVGYDLSLPGFLANFLDGITDRLEISVSDLQIDATLKSHTTTPELDGGNDRPTRANHTIRLSIGRLESKPLQQYHVPPPPQEGYGVAITESRKTRQVMVNGCQILLLPDTSLSPQESTLSELLPRTAGSTLSGLKSEGEDDRETKVVPDPLTNSPSVVHMSVPRATEKTKANQSRQDKYSEVPHMYVSSRSNSQDQLWINTVSGPGDIKQGEEPPEIPPRPLAERKISDANSDLLMGSSTLTHGSDEADDSPHEVEAHPAQPEVKDLSSHSPLEDLTESRLYDHEESTSIYMSALNQGHASKSFNVPGAWDSANADDSRFTTQQKPFDELGHSSSSDKDTPSDPLLQPKSSVVHEMALNENASHKEPSSMPKHRSIRAPTRQASSSSPVTSSSNTTTQALRGVHAAKVLLSVDRLRILSNNEEQQRSLEPVESRHMPREGSGAEDTFADVNRTHTAASVSVHVDASSIDANFDIDSMKSLSSLARHMQPASEDHSLDAEVSKSSPILKVDFACEHFVTRFFTSMHYSPLVGTPFRHQSQACSASDSTSENLFKAKLCGIKASSTRNDQLQKSEISAKKISFGYEDQDILAFRANTDSKASIRDSTTALQSDFVLTMNKSQNPENFTIDVKTRPLEILIDLQRLDETFNWLGGLSSVLELTSSFVSTLKTGDFPNRDNLTADKKVVRFDERQSTLVEGPAMPSYVVKLNIRLGGLHVDIKGHASSLSIKGTAIKMVKRSEGVGLQVESCEISGPCSSGASGPLFYVKLAKVRLEYLAMPKDTDLTRLSHMVVHSPCQGKRDHSDGLMIDTLLRQRRQGGVIRINIARTDIELADLMQLHLLLELSQEMKNLGKVAKYLPEDDRPGLLLLTSIKAVSLRVAMDQFPGILNIDVNDVENALVTFPYLVAVSISTITLTHDMLQDAIGTGPVESPNNDATVPVLWARYIGNEMVPIIRVKMQDIRLEYSPALLSIWHGYKTLLSQSNLFNGFASPVRHRSGQSRLPSNDSFYRAVEDPADRHEDLSPMTPEIDLAIGTIFLGLDPSCPAGKAYMILEDACVKHRELLDASETSVLIERTTLFITQDRGKSPLVDGLEENGAYLRHFSNHGYVIVATAFSPNICVRAAKVNCPTRAKLEMSLHGGLLVLETCADSTQSLQRILNQLIPSTPKTDDLRYRTEAISIADMLESFTGDAYVTTENPQEVDHSSVGAQEQSHHLTSIHQMEDLTAKYESLEFEDNPQIFTSSMLRDDLDYVSSSTGLSEAGDTKRRSQSSYNDNAGASPILDFQPEHFGHRETLNNIDATIDPFSVDVHNFHVIWNLFDGYDWSSTRESIRQAVSDVQARAKEHKYRQSRDKVIDQEHRKEDIVGDFLFNSIYIGIPRDADPSELPQQVNDDIGGVRRGPAVRASDNHDSGQGTSFKASKSGSLHLSRSKSHKVTFEMKGIFCSAHLHSPSTKELQSKTELRIQDFVIFDHLPSSTWKKFATYMRDAGERDDDSPMICVSVSEVRPVQDLAATELRLRVAVLPLRLHVDQDALDFMARFFTFKDERAEPLPPGIDPPFIQRAEFEAIRLKLDFKPKRIDYAGLRAGRTSEFMNFFVLDQAEMTLRHIILYGISGFDRLGQTLNDLWTHDVKQNQLPGVIAGVGAIQPLMGISGGLRDLIVVPVAEYRKDGRVFRSLQKGAHAFAKTTASELVKLGAKLAIGTQNVLESAEGALQQSHDRDQPDALTEWDYADLDPGEREQISLYADQPVGVFQGLRGAFAGLERDLLTTKDVIIAMPGEIREQKTAGGAAKTVMQKAPIVILRPAVGVTKAVSQTLMGVTNALDPGIKHRLGDKYKSH